MTPQEELVGGLLRSLAGVDGWAVLKGWRELPTLRGDLDLITAPSSTERILRRAIEYLGTVDGAEGSVVTCRHIPRVPRLLAALPELGFGDSVFEVDFAEAVPVRGAELVTYDRLGPYLVDDPLGFPRTTDAAERALTLLFKQLRWTSVAPTEPLDDEAWEVLAALLGPVPARLVRSAAKSGSRVPVVAASAALALRGFCHPRSTWRRVTFRIPGWARGRCAFDPRAPEPRRILGVTDFVTRAAACGRPLELPR